MKKINYLCALTSLVFLLTGCMDTAIRLWNGGSYISQKESQLYHECSDKAQLLIREEPRTSIGSEEKQAWLAELSRRTVDCVRQVEN